MSVLKVVTKVLFLSILCGVPCSNLIVLPRSDFVPTKTLVFECPGPQNRNPMTLYDHATGEFKAYHDIGDCLELSFEGGSVSLKTGSWVESIPMGFLLCPSGDLLCDIFNPASPYKRSFHMEFTGQKTPRNLIVTCDDDSYFETDYVNDQNAAPYINFVFPSSGGCDFSDDAGSRPSAILNIEMGDLTDKKQDFNHNGYFISIIKPEANDKEVEGHRYIFKISVSYTSLFVYTMEVCLKKNPRGECVDYQFYVRSKGNSDMISFPISVNSIKADAYVHIKIWRYSYTYSLELTKRSGFSHRVNERILEAFCGKIFQKKNKEATAHVHVLECKADNSLCDTEGTRDVDLTIYGVDDALKMLDFYIQGVKINIDFSCTPELSQCSVRVSMEKHRHTTLEYGREGKFLGLLMADSNSYTGVFKDISITAVAEEETYY